jgi:hypothetical protein
MHVQVTENDSALIAEWIELFTYDNSFGDKPTNLFHKESEQREQRCRNAKLTQRIKVLLEKLTVTQLVKRFSAIYDTRTFIIVFARGHHSCLD